MLINLAMDRLGDLLVQTPSTPFSTRDPSLMSPRQVLCPPRAPQGPLGHPSADPHIFLHQVSLSLSLFRSLILPVIFPLHSFPFRDFFMYKIYYYDPIFNVLSVCPLRFMSMGQRGPGGGRFLCGRKNVISPSILFF